jgi:peptidoglycan/LPS O-acetylase OafA/YrhL
VSTATQSDTRAPDDTRSFDRAHQYRPDIDGLRAVAVLSVIFFHISVSGFPGGFLGVDIFFVISGYLITEVVVREVANGRFSFIDFYERRFRRIFPAFFVMLAFSSLTAYFFLAPDEFVTFARSVVGAITFSSNFYFWSKTGYFNAPADGYPLLHTWSLAIEEQFYLFYPLILIVGIQRLKSLLLLIVCLLASASFGLSIWLATWNADAAFYFSPARVWELLLGSLLVLLRSRTLRPAWVLESLSVAGVVMIALGLALVGGANIFPRALMPCLGTALVIFAGSQRATFVTGWLGATALLLIGKMSYSLYLWHWPIFVFGKIALDRPLELAEATLLLALTFCSGAASYYIIEQPYRGSDGVFRQKGIFISSGVMVAMFAVLAAATIDKEGFPRRFNKNLELDDPDVQHKLCLLTNQQSISEWGGERCLLNQISGPTVLLWGDSYAAHYWPAFYARRSLLRFNVVQLTLEACAPALRPDSNASLACQSFNREADKIIRSYNITSVIIAANWRIYGHSDFQQQMLFERLADTISGLRARGIKVVVIGQTANFNIRVPRIYWWRLRGGQLTKPDGDADPGHELNARLRLVTSGTILIEPSLGLCKKSTCTLGEGLKPYYSDTGHFTTEGSIKAMEPLWETLAEFATAE